jgi:hypothetical protein
VRRTSLLLIAVAATAACSIVNPDRKRTEREPAYIRYAGIPPVLQTPDTVTVRTPFVVTVRTIGGGCVDPGDTQATVLGNVVEVRPFDVFTTHLPQGWACPDNLLFYTHTVSVRIDEAGAATVRVFGRAGPGDTLAIAERTVIVR